jgi:hypothetical protein
VAADKIRAFHLAKATVDGRATAQMAAVILGVETQGGAHRFACPGLLSSAPTGLSFGGYAVFLKDSLRRILWLQFFPELP